MKHIVYLLCLLSLASCYFTTNQAVLTRKDYAEIDIGTPVAALKERFGKPYQVHSKPPDSQVFEYIERLSADSRIIEQRSYFFVINGGVVIGKYVKTSNAPAFEAIYSDDPYPSY